MYFDSLVREDIPEPESPRRARTREKLSWWQQSWSKTTEWIDKKRNQTGVPLIVRQDCFKEVPIPDQTLDDFEFNATLASGLISEKFKPEQTRDETP